MHAFTLRCDAGIIRTALPNMDREARQEYDVVIQAKDMGGHMGGLSGTTEVKITLTDVNDNPPKFPQSESFCSSTLKLPSVFPPIRPFVLHVRPSVCLYVQMSGCLCVCLSVCLSVCPTACLPLFQSVFPVCVRLAVSLAVHLSVYPSIRLFLSFCLSVWWAKSILLSLSLCLSLCLGQSVLLSLSVFLSVCLGQSVLLSLSLCLSLCRGQTVLLPLSVCPPVSLSLSLCAVGQC